MTGGVFLVGSLCMAAVLIGWGVWRFSIAPQRARRVLDGWARAQGLVVEEVTVSYLGSATLDTRACFVIRARDAAGRVRRGEAVAGYRWFHCLSPRVDVEWDEAPRRRTTG